MKAQYPFTPQSTTPSTIANGDFVAGNLYRCVHANPNAKKGENGESRFTQGCVYMAVANATSTSETDDRPPMFLVDNNFRAVNCGRDAKLKSQFVDA